MGALTPAWFEPKFKKGAIHRLQSQGFLLKSAVEEASDTDGSTVTWRRAGTGAATPLQVGLSKSPVMNAGRDTVTATFADYEANEFIKKADLNKMSENEQQIAQQSAAMALGRKFDQIVLATMDSDTVNITNIGTGATAIAPTDLMTAQGAIFDVGAGTYEYFAAVPPIFMQQLELYREISSSDFTGEADYPLLKAIGARKWRNITIIPMPSSFFNVPSANQADGYIWVKQAFGFEWNKKLSCRVDWLPQEKGFFVAMDMGCAAANILPEGIKRLRFATNVALSRPTP
jgi:hypothetical protein